MKNKSSILGDVEVGDIEPHKPPGKESPDPEPSFCRRHMWKFILMGLLIILVALAAIIVPFVTLLDKHDHCPGPKKPFHADEVSELFATKTLYTTALNYMFKLSLPRPYLSSSETTPTNDASNILHSTVYPSEDIHVPSIYSPDKSLKSVDDVLKSNNCTVKQLYFIGRHAARLPSTKDLENINKIMATIINRIDLPKYSDTSSQDPSESDLSAAKNKSITCSDPLSPYKNWKPFARPTHGNLITQTGVRETVAIAERLKSIYPSLFDSSLTDITLGTTGKIRTAQTAINFIRQLENYTPEGCHLANYPNDETTDPLKLEEIQTDTCYKQFIEKHEKTMLEFHHTCKKLVVDRSVVNHGFDLKNLSNIKNIAEYMSGQLSLLSDDKKLTTEEAKVIYDVCRYETAFKGSPSVWCGLFRLQDLQFYEYLADVDDFYNAAYGDLSMFHTACPVTSNLAQTIREYMFDHQRKPQARLYFTHSEAIQRILAACVNMANDPAYSIQTVKNNLNRGEAPSTRDWRTSLLTPFSANIAFILYGCPSSADLSSLNDKNGQSSANSLELDVSRDTNMFRMVTTLNERPIILDGCSNYACDRAELSHSRLFQESRCNMTELCRRESTYI